MLGFCGLLQPRCLGRCLCHGTEPSPCLASNLVLSCPKQPPDQVKGRPSPGGDALAGSLHSEFCSPKPQVGKLEEEVSQSEAALGPTCGQGVNCAPVSSLPPLPLFFFFLSHLWAVVWGAGRLRGLSPGPSPSQEAGPPQLSVRAAREGGHFLLLPLSVSCLAAPQNASRSLLPNPWDSATSPRPSEEQAQ